MGQVDLSPIRAADPPAAGAHGTGRHVRFSAWDLLRMQDGEIVEITQACDLFTLMNQIGVLQLSCPDVNSESR